MILSNHCPISEEPAEEVSPAHGDFAEFVCPGCGRFRISRSALKTIVNLRRKEKEALLNKARSDAQGGEGIPFIRNMG
ncbi:hypothetical protein [Phyllobacterium sophorae]|jgi:hypothetical protein|uniref:Uncharacterized protein n=1 Tax=Phyllobacterium sophorae TaxID=1520277 RepID=A0A2P7BG12_9HYPH|nr:hypothetical protein [Phyllobacterium sophorae]PSH65431.1 hypothetical protein CU103_10605 [Phyllobacterium sophorae]